MPLKYFRSLCGLFIILALLPGCTSTFFGTVLVLTFKDVMLYIALAFIISIIVSVTSPGKTVKIFWTWFILSLLLTPLAGFIYFLVLLSRKAS